MNYPKQATKRLLQYNLNNPHNPHNPFPTRIQETKTPRFVHSGTEEDPYAPSPNQTTPTHDTY